MRAAIVSHAGALPACSDFPEPAPIGDQPLLSLVGAGVHHVVRSMASGDHYGSSGVHPMVPGVDAVACTEEGQLVYTGWAQPPWGTMAERMATRIGLPLPEGADPIAIAAGLNPGMSGWLPLVTRREEIGALGAVLVLGATGMSGRMAVQSAGLLGADHVVAVGRDVAGLEEVAALGADTVALGSGDLVETLAAALGGRSPSVVLDYVWGPVAEAAFAALDRHGLDDDTADISYVQIGDLAGNTAAVPAQLLRGRRIRVVGNGAGSVSTERVLAELPAVMARIAEGALAVPYVTFPLGEVDRAWVHVGRGRAVVVPD